MKISFGTLCTGIDAAAMAARGTPFYSVFSSEIEPFPCALLASRYPDVPNLGDMTKTTAQITNCHSPSNILEFIIYIS